MRNLANILALLGVIWTPGQTGTTLQVLGGPRIRALSLFLCGPESALPWLVLFMPLKSGDRLTTYLNKHQIDETYPGLRERRRRARVQAHWPICFTQPDTEKTVEAITHDLSSDGFYCQANTAFVPGELRECTLGVPMHQPNSGDRPRLVFCRVRVIRVEALGEDGFYGVGCRIEDYRFMSSGNGDRALSGGSAHE